jgi:hypothetical protein
MVKPRPRAGRASFDASDFNFFDDVDEAPARVSQLSELERALGESSQLSDAAAVIKPAGLSLLSTPALHYFRKNRGWAVTVNPGVDLERAATKLFAELIARRSVGASDPLLHDHTLYVLHDGGALVRRPPEKAPAAPKVSGLKHQLIYKAEQVFGPSSVKITGSAGDYKLTVTPVGKLRGKFRGGYVKAADLDALDLELDQLIVRAKSLIEGLK